MKDGGSAFPIFDSTRALTDYECNSPGMTLRDWFAGNALIGILGPSPKDIDAPEEIFDIAPDIAKMAYAVADAMIVHREEGNKKQEVAKA